MRTKADNADAYPSRRIRWEMLAPPFSAPAPQQPSPVGSAQEQPACVHAGRLRRALAVLESSADSSVKPRAVVACRFNPRGRILEGHGHQVARIHLRQLDQGLGGARGRSA
jgi:hypothetical protein